MAAFAQGALIEQQTITTPFGPTLTLTVSSKTIQILQNSTSEGTLTLPAATTLKTGRYFIVVNECDYPVIVALNGGAQLTRILPRTTRIVRVVNNGSAAGVWSVSDQEDVLSPLMLTQNVTPNASLIIKSNQVLGADGTQSALPPIDGTYSTFDQTSINFTAGVVTPSGNVLRDGGTWSMPTATGTGKFYRVAFVYVAGTNKVDSTWSAEAATRSALANPADLFGNLSGLPIGYIDLESATTTTYKTAGSTTTVIENYPLAATSPTIVRFAAAGAGTGSGGAGGINYVKTPEGDSGTSNWAANGTVTLSTTSTAGELLRGTKSFKLVKDGTSPTSSDYVQADMSDVAPNDLKQDVFVSFDYKNLTAGNAEGDWEVYLVDVDNGNALIQPSIYKIPADQGVFRSAVRLNTAGNTYKLRFLNKVASRDLTVDHVTVGPEERINASAGMVQAYAIEDRSVGDVGLPAGAYLPLADSDFPVLANAHYYHLNVDANDDSGNTAINLTNTNVVFDAKGLFNRESVARFNGTSARLSSTDTFFRPGNNTSWSFGCWTRAYNWNTSVTVFSNAGSVSDRGSEILIDSGAGQALLFRATNTAGSQDFAISVPNNFEPGSLHHLAFVYDFGSTQLRAYVDGKLVGSLTAANTRSGALGSIGAKHTSATDFFGGEIQDFFFNNGTALSDAQVLAIASKRYKGEQLKAGHELDASSFPLTSLTGKISFWNLGADALDDSGNGINLTNNGTIPFTDFNLIGASGAARLLSTSSQYFSSTNSFFNPGNRDFFCGGWFRARNWATTGQGIISQYPTTGSDRGWRLLLDTGGLVFNNSSDGTANSNIITYPVSDLDPGSWHHIAVRYSAAGLTGVAPSAVWTLFVDGVPVASAQAFGAINRTTSAVAFNIGASTNLSFFSGSIKDCFYGLGYITDQDILKLYSKRITLSNVATLVTQPQWEGYIQRDDGRLRSELNDEWIVDKSRSGYLYMFSDESGDSKLDLRLFDAVNRNLIVASDAAQHLYNGSTTVTDDTTSFSYGPEGVLLPTGSPSANFKKRVRLPRAGLTTQHYLPMVKPQGRFEWQSAEAALPHVKIGATDYGIWTEAVSGSDTDVDVWFGAGGATPSDTWTALNSAGWRWKYERLEGIGVGELSQASTLNAGYLGTSKQKVPGIKVFQGIGGYTAIDQSMTIDSDEHILMFNPVIAAGVTLTVNGTLYVKGVISGPGTVAGTGNVYSDVGHQSFLPGTRDGVLTQLGLPGFTDGTFAPAGYAGEVINVVQSANFEQTAPTLNNYYDVTGMSIVLTPGRWLIHVGGNMYIATNDTVDTKAANGALALRLGTAANNSSSTVGLLQNGLTSIATGTTGTLRSTIYGWVSFVYPVSITTNTTYKLSIAAFNYTGSPIISSILLAYNATNVTPGYIRAVRLP